MLPKRIRPLNDVAGVTDGESVLYVMSRDQRIQDNHALVAAQQTAHEKQLPLVVFFNLLTTRGVRAKEHFQFMLKSLEQVEASLAKLNIGFVLKNGDAHKNLETVVKDIKPVAIYFDFSPLAGPRKLRTTFATATHVPCYEVDTHNIIPAWVASDHQEFAAHTFRRKVHQNLSAFLVEPDPVVHHPYSPVHLGLASQEPDLGHLQSNGSKLLHASGETEAYGQLSSFIDTKLDRFALDRNDPIKDGLSNLSPYLHFGQLSSLRVALAVLDATQQVPLLYKEARMASTGDQPSRNDGMNALFEEMIVRKELSDNFCLYSPSYTDFSGVADWAKETLDQHRHDKRNFVYTRTQWEAANTHDQAWNAAQKQMMQTGKMHGYMRMYWAKKMLEWSASPEDALADCIYLNDKYSLDGGDPNGYVGILWSIAGLHDRPWAERPVFGKVRYMNFGGLKRKFDIETYILKQDVI